jgi:hypothetical protein
VTTRRETQNHVIAGREFLDAGTYGFHHSGAFVTQHGRQWQWDVLIENRKVRVAHPNRHDLDQHLISDGNRQVDVLELKRPCLPNDCRQDFHVT